MNTLFFIIIIFYGMFGNEYQTTTNDTIISMTEDYHIVINKTIEFHIYDDYKHFKKSNLSPKFLVQNDAQMASVVSRHIYQTYINTNNLSGLEWLELGIVYQEFNKYQPSLLKSLCSRNISIERVLDEKDYILSWSLVKYLKEMDRLNNVIFSVKKGYNPHRVWLIAQSSGWEDWVKDECKALSN